MGELIVEIMRIENDKPLNETALFSGPFPSGAPAIFISAAAQLGNKTKIWGGVGRDKFGEVILNRLKRDGVDVSGVIVSESGVTGSAIVAYTSGGDREFIFNLDGTASGRVRFTETPDIPDYFHVMGCSLMVNDEMKDGIERATRYFSDNGAKISFDPNIRPSLLGKRGIMDVAGGVLSRCSVFLPGRDELLMFAEGKSDTQDAAAFLFDRFDKLEVIHVKYGKKGSETITRSGSTPIPVYPIEKARPIVDPTGAGDSFDAAFISALAAGKTLKEAGGLAAKAGAINSAAFGPMEGDIKNDIYRELV
ncbi:MAG: sugar kinase [Spirochaetaceae bacterium]|jgi:sugar/nucleoside kinase (ribokinase family)|nr:sugar kinase [Spirochaetaceae bacterium]